MQKKFTPFIKAILYADLFDYPLTDTELWHYAIGKAKKSDYQEFLKHPPQTVITKSGYFFTAGRDLSEQRKRKITPSKKKLILAKKVALLLSDIPTIRFIGVSGSLSLLNATEADDIDFFIITKKNTIWITRLLVALFLESKGLRRKRHGKNATNRICVNMLVDEEDLGFTKKRQDLYTAHEIIQVMPVFDHEQTYEKFLKANKWTAKFLPNAKFHILPNTKPRETIFSAILRFSAIESTAKYIQLLYMKRHRTKEEVSDTILAFHPVDYRKRTLEAFAKTVRQYYEEV